MSQGIKVENDMEAPQLEGTEQSSGFTTKRKMIAASVMAVACVGAAAAIGYTAGSNSSSVSSVETTKSSAAESSIEVFNGLKSNTFNPYPMGPSRDSGINLDDTTKELSLINYGLDGLKCTTPYCNDMSPRLFVEYQPYMGYIKQSTKTLDANTLEAACPRPQYISHVRCSKVNVNQRCEEVEFSCSYLFGGAQGYDFRYGSETDYSKEYCSEWGPNYFAVGVKRVPAGDDPIDSMRVKCISVEFNGKVYKPVSLGASESMNVNLEENVNTYYRAWQRGFDSVQCLGAGCENLVPFRYKNSNSIFTGRWTSQRDVLDDSSATCENGRYIGGVICTLVTNNGICAKVAIECFILDTQNDKFRFSAPTRFDTKTCSERGDNYFMVGLERRGNGLFRETRVSCATIETEA